MYNKKKRHQQQVKPHYHRTNEGEGEGEERTEEQTSSNQPSGENSEQQPKPANKRNRRRRNRPRNKNRNLENQQQSQQPHLIDKPKVVIEEDVSDVTFPEELIPEIERDTPEGEIICPICNSVIKNVTIAVNHHESGTPAHFDCVLKQLRQQHRNKLGKNRKVYYIGGGRFAIVKEKYDKKGRFRNYHVLEKIEYEDREDN